ncbi:ABC transporter substrate-binding protein [Desemzia sp. RIT804]|uniref:ABC transporter substrate-binding protein n=1 Tax=Desemzia sp. RIT 804 TaxID=2810209 RepID=UPI001951C23D|nr:ABC transporter substrate-binding protein [Desemzia sp. RIT 804]MBM6614253.1 ABC transporter substrate-binding protein [Desemzia sp. RIT 804]
MVKRKKSWLSLTITAGTALLLAACGGENEEGTGSEGTGDDGDKVSIEFWSFWGSGLRRDAIEEIIEDFNTSQDEIEVEYVYQPWGDIWTKSLASIAAGDPPDVIVQDINSVQQRAEAQQSTNLQEYISQEDDMESLFYPHLWETVFYEENAYALPFNTDTQVLFYNKDAFEEVGLDPETPPATWEELEEYARALDVQNGDSWERIGFYPLWNLGSDVWALNADNGVSWFDEEGNVTINTPEKVDALEWILEWQDYYGANTINSYEAEFGSGVADPFISGLVSIRAQNINYYTNLLENAPEDFNFGVAPLPEYEEGSGNWSWGGGFVLEVPYGAENPEASYEFMKYLTSTEVQEKFGLNSFDIMANQEANTNLISHPDLDEEGQMIYEMADRNLESTVITPVPLTAPDFSSLVNGEIDNMMLGNQSPEEALEAAQASVENLVEQNE